VHDLEYRLDRIEELLAQRIAHDETIAKLITDQNQLLHEQSLLLENIQALVGFEGEVTIHDRLAQMIRDAAAQAAGPGPEQSARS
jgi:hypothetical protein